MLTAEDIKKITAAQIEAQKDYFFTKEWTQNFPDSKVLSMQY